MQARNNFGSGGGRNWWLTLKPPQKKQQPNRDREKKSQMEARVPSPGPHGSYRPVVIHMQSTLELLF